MMPEIHKKAKANYSAQQMYDLVNDVASYPQFVPGCVDSKVVPCSELEVVAELVLEKKGLRQSFATRNQLQPGRSIIMNLEKGPFKHLKGVWTFTEMVDHSCEVSLDLSFKFANPMWSMMLGPVFTQLIEKLVDSFVKRAEEVYS